MDAGTALSNLQAWAQWTDTSSVALGAGLFFGMILGVAFARWFPHRPRGGFAHDLLVLTPAIVACLLWGAWLGIMAAKFAP